MPPPPPHPPLSYKTSPTLHPYTLRYHPVATSAVPYTHTLCVGAAVVRLAPPAPDQGPRRRPRILLLQRSATEKALPHRWELPGGGAEPRDLDSLSSAARELWEETGLRAVHARGLVGCYQWAGLGPSEDATPVPGDQAWSLPNGRVGVIVPPVPDAAAAAGGREVTPPERRDAWRKYTYLFEVETDADGDARVVIDPEEHETFVWASEDEVRADRCGDVRLDWTSENQKLDVLKAFEMVKK
ncbi:hypothetical protein CCHL11_07788 [Colletotrichum chlorophyti]|uniref:Nudix hydrolase domain-containing protein n=1 Tax=Colletotrichum chlorophyti TaxID=708187 RepID=A0A1Q8RN99_9PEZI|nr:hypothetical protein CCHL11_07788 [Colletotrichum chlorophyti]